MRNKDQWARSEIKLAEMRVELIYFDAIEDIIKDFDSLVLSLELEDLDLSVLVGQYGVDRQHDKHGAQAC